MLPGMTCCLARSRHANPARDTGSGGPARSRPSLPRFAGEGWGGGAAPPRCIRLAGRGTSRALAYRPSRAQAARSSSPAITASADSPGSSRRSSEGRGPPTGISRAFSPKRRLASPGGHHTSPYQGFERSIDAQIGPGATEERGGGAGARSSAAGYASSSDADVGLTPSSALPRIRTRDSTTNATLTARHASYADYSGADRTSMSSFSETVGSCTQ